MPANRLKEIQRVVVEVTAPSARPDWRGNYSDTRLAGEVSSLRNVPNFNFTEYTVSGYVFKDTNKNGVKDGSEIGIPGATVVLGGYLNRTTDANGFYSVKAPAGTYTLTHTPAVGYGPFGPDTYTLTLPPSVTKSFADTARAGGWVTITVYNDLKNNNKKDGDDYYVEGVDVIINGDTDNPVTTDVDGVAMLFAPVGAFTATVVLPDSFTSSQNPFTGTMTNGGSASKLIPIFLADAGYISGKVYIDNNRNGAWDNGEPGVKDVWVGAYKTGQSPIGFGFTDNNGLYTFKVPANDPPKGQPYTVECIPNTGYAISSLTINDVYVKKDQTAKDNNFGLGGYVTIKANANRVLSLASGDFVENDSSFNAGSPPRQDADIVLGAETWQNQSNIMGWFNDYDKKPLFDNKPSFERDAAYWVTAVALDSLDLNPPRRRLDMITGTRFTASGNLFVWYTQGTSGNQGFPPAAPSRSYTTQDNGDVQALLTTNCVGGAGIDIIAGTRSPVTGTGTIEVWQSDNATTPAFTRVQTLPGSGGAPAMGEIVSMNLINLGGLSTAPELVVGTRTGQYKGQVLVFELVSGVWTYRVGYTLASDEVTGMTSFDLDGDGKNDVVTGTMNGYASGKLQFWQNIGSGSTFAFKLKTERDVAGNVTAVTSGDFGGTTRPDILVGWRENDNSYKGGIDIWYTDSGDIPSSGTDPSGGDVKNVVVAITVNNFDYGIYPNLPVPPYLTDFAIAVKKSGTEGEMWVFIR